MVVISALIALLTPLVALANYNGVDPYEEYGQRIHASQSVSPLTDALFGDSVSLYNGQTTFDITDVSLPGNNTLPVALARRLAIVDHREMPTGGDGLLGFGDWDMDVPYIDGTFTQNNGWTLGPSGSTARCSDNTDWPNTWQPVQGGYAPYGDIWGGNHLHVPGQGDQALLANNQPKSPAYASRATYRWVTTNHWKLSCIGSVANLAGEGFVAVSPSGVSYTFNYAVARNTSSYAWQYNTKVKPTGIPRVHIYLLATHVQDRFGNWVNYTYSGDELTGISSSDGRAITVNWSNGLVSSVTSSLGTWSYSYATASWTNQFGVNHTWPYLSSVTRPDGSKWTYAITAGALITNKQAWPDNEPLPPTYCQTNPDPNTGSFVYQIGAPSGAVGTFSFDYIRAGRSYVPLGCINDPTPTHNYPQHVYDFIDGFAITSKQITGPGLATETWRYDGMGSGNGAYYTASSPYQTSTQEPYIPPGTCSACGLSKTVTVTGPTGTSLYTFGIQYARNEGQLLKKQVADAAGNILQTTAYSFVSDVQAANAPFADIAGQDLLPNFTNPMGNRTRPIIETVIGQDGASFTTSVNSFDAWARASSETASSSLGYSKTETTTYADDVGHWVLGLVTQSATNNTVVSQTVYDTLDRPTSEYAFGRLVSAKTWNGDGTLATAADGGNHVTTFANWYRGLPGKVTFADGSSETAAINGNGWIVALTNENGSTTSYAYDAMGRLAQINYPSGDDVAWNATQLSFTQIAGAELGIPGGHWKQVVQTGNDYAVTFFDALWRPLVTEHYDAGNQGGTLSQVVQQYDAGGRKVFTSYPSRNVTNYAQALPGTRTSYDALGRPTQVQQDAELGVLTTTTQYTPGFETKVTDPRGYSTTTSYQAYGSPTTQWPASITTPEGELTVIMRDVFGKPISVTRTGMTQGSPEITRSYVYNAYQQLCKQVEPETGATAFGYDAAGNLAWSAAGLGLPDTGSCDASAAYTSGARVDHGYDARHRIVSQTFPDGNGNQTWSYTPDGQPSTLTRQNNNGSNVLVTNSYHYDKRGLLVGEAITQANWYTWTLGYGYDANGHLANETYPDGLTVAFAPNALGQPTQAGSYAANATYAPDGSLAGFSYGNGIQRMRAENVRGLPSAITDTGHGVTPIQQSYLYDADGDPVSITDAANAAQARSLTYDGRDRLATSVMSAQGSAPTAYRYDVLDNLTAVQRGTTARTYGYDASNRLTQVNDPATGTIALTWDARGNIATRGSQRYAFDGANRLLWVWGGESYRYDALGRRILAWSFADSQNILSMYSHAGALVHQDNQRAGSLQHDFIYLGNQLVAVVDTTPSGQRSVRYQHTDAQGTVAAQTDGNRVVLSRSVYADYGAAQDHGNDDQPGYTGHLQDSLTGLTYMQQRYYDPTLQRFLSTDPVQTDPNTGVSFNRWFLHRPSR